MFNRGLEAIWLIKHSDYTNHNTFHITKKKAFFNKPFPRRIKYHPIYT